MSTVASRGRAHFVRLPAPSDEEVEKILTTLLAPPNT